MNVYKAIQRVPRNCLSHKNWLIMMPQPLVSGFPYSHSIGVVSALWTVIQGRITFKTIKPAPSLVPSTYGSPQCRKKGLIPMLFFILTEGQLQTHFISEFLLEGVRSRAQAAMFMNPDPSDHTSSAAVIPMLPLHLK